MSTISRNGWPHVVPVGYAYVGGKFYTPSNYRAKKVRNLEKNSSATLVVDDETLESGIMLECNSRVVEGKRAQRLREHMRKVKHWQNDRGTLIIELTPVRKVTWWMDEH